MSKKNWLYGLVMAATSFAAVGADEAVEPAHPASGFWTCNGIKLHMGVNMVAWTDLNTGELYTIAEDPTPVDPKDKDHKVKGTNYLFKSTRNPAVVKYFIVDTTGKNLYIRDDIRFFKSYRCKREQ